MIQISASEICGGVKSALQPCALRKHIIKNKKQSTVVMKSRGKAEIDHIKKIQIVIHIAINLGPKVDVGGSHFCNQQK